MAASDDIPLPDWTKAGNAKLYSNIALFPELGRFRRFTAEWAKLLHDDTHEILMYQAKITTALRDANPIPGGMYIWDIPRAAVEEKYPDIYAELWKPYEQALRQYGNDVCVSQQIVTQAGQAAYATKRLSRFKETFENNVFSPTGEDSCFYLGRPETHDSWSWRLSTSHDFLAERIFAAMPWLENNLFRYFRQCFCIRKVPRSACPCDSAAEGPPYIRYHRLIEVVDVLTCIFISALMTGAIFAIKSVKPWGSRGGVIGVLGTVFSIAVKVLAGGPSRRIEVYAATAAFFAVASVFVSNTDD